MQRLQRALLLSLAMLFAAPRADAVTTFTANLTGGQEVPPVTTTASGFATFVLNDAQDKLTVSVTVNGLDFTGNQTPNNPNDNLVNAHIHCCAAPGTNAGVRWGFIGNPFNNSDNDGVTTPFANGVGGTFVGEWDNNEGNGGTTLAAQLAGILSNLSYINFHTVGFTGGEIRGQIIRDVPEPATALLFGLGLLGIGAVAWRRK